MANISLNPMQTTHAKDAFGVYSDGLYAGVALDDPANRYNLASGYVDTMDGRPLWGGIPVSTFIPGTHSAPRGSAVMRGYNRSLMTGITVFNQAHNGLVSPNSPVPQYGTGMSVSYYRFGSNMRIPVKCSEAVVALGTTRSNVNQLLAWDWANNQLELASSLTFKTVDGFNGNVTNIDGVRVTVELEEAQEGLKPGMYIVITFSDGVKDENTGYTPVLEVTGKTIVIADPSPDEKIGTELRFYTSNASGFSLPVQLIEIQAGNSRTVNYDQKTGNLTWESGQSCAVLLLSQ